MVKGSNRKLFRKPGMARRAIGILASSPELAQAANRNMPVRLQGGGDPLFEQARQQARYMLSRPNVSYGMNEDQMTQSIYQNLLSQNQPTSRIRPQNAGGNLTRQEQINQTIQSIFGSNVRGPEQFTPAGAFDTRARQAAGQDFVSRNPATSTDTQPFALDSNLEDQRSALEMSDQELRTRQAELLSELESLEDRPGGKRKDPLTRQSVQEELNQISVARRDIKARQTALDAISSGDDSGIRGAIEFGDVDRTEAMGDKMLADLAKRKTAGMERSEGVGETLRGIGRFFAPSSERLEKLEADRKAFREALERDSLFDEVEGMVDSDVLMEQVTADRVKRLDQEVKDKFDINFEDIVSPDREGASERVSPLRPYGYDPSGLPEDSAFGTKTRKRLNQIEQVLADDDKADKDSKLSSTRRGELQAELKELNRLNVGQDKFFRDVGIPEFSDKNYKQNEDQIKQIESRIESQIRRRDKGIENKNEKLINSANEEIDRLNAVRDGALLDRAFMDNQKGESPQEQVVNAEDENALLESLNKASNSLLDDVQLNRPEDLDNVGPDQVSLSRGAPGETITNIDVVSKFIVETDDEVTPDDKENAKEILREQGQPPELADRPDFWHYVTMAGLGIAAGESDNALTNVAKGLLMGLDQKARDDKDYRKEGYERWLAGEKLNLDKQNVELTGKQLQIAETRAETDRVRAEAQLAGIQNRNTEKEAFAKALINKDPSLSEAEALGYAFAPSEDQTARAEDKALAQAREIIKADSTKKVLPLSVFDREITVYNKDGKLSFTNPF